MVRRGSYVKACQWIAMNDEPGLTAAEAEELEGLISVLLVADIFYRTPKEVVSDLLSWREKYKATGKL
jgi:hypothetical protein